MHVNPYLTFDGDCEEAFQAYKTILGGEIVAMIPMRGHPPRITCRLNGARRLSMPAWSVTACCSWVPTLRQTAMNR